MVGEAEISVVGAVAAAKRDKLLDLAVLIGLIFTTLTVYAQVGNFEFLNFDDGVIVAQNVHVQEGLTAESIRWALTAVVSANWMPVTLLSHIVDTQLFELRSGIHHLMNVLLHILAAMLLYLTLLRATRARASSAFVAFVFALHPLHVESVAWISERKDVLGAFFWFLGLYGYVCYCERPSRGRYSLVVAAPFCLGLMSKPMLVTFPFALLLLDVWPLRRANWPRTVWEKLPLFALSGVVSGVTYFAQSSQGAVQNTRFVMLAANAFLSYVTYIGQMFWPVRLAVFYPFPPLIPVWKGVLAVAAMVGLSSLALLLRKRFPYAMVGWFWYVGTMVPMIGLLQAGKQAHADRYMYIPMVGLLMILAWGAADIGERWPRSLPAIGVGATVVCAVFLMLSFEQVGYWRNSGTLFERTLEITKDNWLAENNLGIYLVERGQLAEAYPHFEAALRIDPDYAAAHNNLGGVILQLGDCAAAVPHFEAAIRAQPNFAMANYNLGGCQMLSGNYQAAVPYFESAIRNQGDYRDAHASLGAAFAKIPGREPDAVREYEEALRLTPEDAELHVRLGALLAQLGRTGEAIAHLEAAMRIRPNSDESRTLDLLRTPPE